MSLQIPNLDEGFTPEELDKLADTFVKLSTYCTVRKLAKEARLDGQMSRALAAEQLCDTLYRQLPPEVRW